MAADAVASGGRGGASSGGKQNNPTAGDNSGATTQGNDAAEIVVTAISLDSARVSQFYMMGLNERLRPAGSVSLSLGPTAQGGSLSSGWNGDYISSYVDDHRLASSFSELDRWESGFEELLTTHQGDFSTQDIQAYRNGFASNRDMLTINTAIADMYSNQIVFAGIGAPALVAGGAVAVPLVAGYAGSFYVGGTTASTVASGGAGFVAGGTFGAGFEYGKNSAFGLDNTVGGYTTAVVGGGLGGTGLRLVPTKYLANSLGQAANRGLVGAFSGFIGEGSGQLVTAGGDFRQLDANQLLLQGGIGGSLGAALPDVRWNGLTAGRNSSVAIYAGLQTRLNNGNISRFQVGYATSAGAANAVKGLYAQGAGATVDGVIKRASR